ncbi:NADH dehydrogenase [ubiquinone] 1 beta subcomplex subunit 11, mitochondrial-like [Diadema antillarum]|uniref:NADH dehydrogenase [ubiquinone] 1 beta subcomplex subunit 11, mitochondrial-like n=1 Tax=Diadema antillarum TaxID=105358 RepID=UPI003A88D7C8
MASLSRAVWRLSRKTTSSLSRTSPLVRHNLRSIPCLLYSSTTKKVSQSEFVIGKQTEVDPARVEEIIKEGSRVPSDTDATDSGYVTHGFHPDPYWDTWTYRIVFFTTISVALVFGPFLLHYAPDATGREWAMKEAQIVLDERRAAGQPVIEPDFIDPSKLVLPESDPEPYRTM